MVSDEEQQRILAALASLQETGASADGEILNKLGDFFKAKPVNWVSIDFSDWSGRHKELFEQIKESILCRRVMEFDYYGQSGEMTRRTVEPMQLLFKDYTWYVRDYCRKRNAMRLFKVYRMKRVKVLEEIYAVRDVAPEEPEDENYVATAEEFPEVVFWIDGKEAYRIYDRFEEEEITRLPDGNFEIRMKCFIDDWVYGVILSFGPSARVIGPESVKQEIGRRIAEMKEIYN